MKKLITIAILLLSIAVHAQLNNERVQIKGKAPFSERLEPEPFYEPNGYYNFKPTEKSAYVFFGDVMRNYQSGLRTNQTTQAKFEESEYRAIHKEDYEFYIDLMRSHFITKSVLRNYEEDKLTPAPINPKADTCYKVLEILAFNMGVRSTLAEYKYLCKDTVTNEKYVVTLVNNWEKDGKPNPAPIGPLCIYRGILHSNGKTFTVTSIK